MRRDLAVAGANLLAENRGGTAILALDVSASMKDRVFQETSKLRLLADALPDAKKKMARNGTRRIGWIVFSSRVTTWPVAEDSATSPIETVRLPDSFDLRHAPGAGGCTALVDALLCGIQMAYQQTELPRRVVAMTDGVENCSVSWKEGNRRQTKGLIAQAKADGIFIGLVGFTKGSDKQQLETLAVELGIECHISQHDESAESVARSICDAEDTMSSMASGRWPSSR